jgi:sterol desaturase/sphingolipid hydroxylase (fatty acid hydroxylase superfamily)
MTARNDRAEERKESRDFWINHAVDLTAATVIACFGAIRYPHSLPGAVTVFLAGVLLWLIMEYPFHRWFLHVLFRKIHSDHHRRPRKFVSGPWFAHPLTAIAICAALTTFLIPATAALFVAGLYVGYIHFRIIHRMVHYCPRLMRGRFWGQQLHIHALHHAHPGTNFGFGTMFWDRVFGTFMAPPPVSPARSCRSASAP